MMPPKNTDSPLIRISQGHLETLDRCPWEFVDRYCRHSAPPMNPHQRQKAQRGKDFHRFMEQQALGLSLEPWRSQAPQLVAAAEMVWAHSQKICPPSPDRFVEAEWMLSRRHHSIVLTAICDLVVGTADAAMIFDWKTYRQPPNPEDLRHHWQTRLYLYLLADHYHYHPDRLSMVYWFLDLNQETPSPEHLRSVTIPYSQGEHQQTTADLAQHLDRLEHFFHEPQAPITQFFPHDRCGYCAQTSGSPAPDWAALTNLGAIAPPGS